MKKINKSDEEWKTELSPSTTLTDSPLNSKSGVSNNDTAPRYSDKSYIECSLSNVSSTTAFAKIFFIALTVVNSFPDLTVIPELIVEKLFSTLSVLLRNFITFSIF